MAAYDFPTELPENARPYHIYQAADFIDYLVATYGITPLVSTTDMRAFADQWVLDIQDPSYYTDPGQVKTYYDGRCNGTGFYPLSNDTDIPADTQIIQCDSCDGWGYTTTQNIPKVKFY